METLNQLDKEMSGNQLFSNFGAKCLHGYLVGLIQAYQEHASENLTVQMVHRTLQEVLDAGKEFGLWE